MESQAVFNAKTHLKIVLLNCLPGRGVQPNAELVGVRPVAGDRVVLRGEVVAAVQPSLPAVRTGH